MDKKSENSRHAIVILHEIYGINEFIKDQYHKFKGAGYDVFIPNIINKPPFSYDESKEAYDYFTEKVGFEVYKEIGAYVNQLKNKYEHVFIVGYSVGATIAWRCSENTLCSGIVACYGSRIRDYTSVNPSCPTLLLFAKEDSFDVHDISKKLQDKNNISIIAFEAKHGFLDSHNKYYDIQQARLAEETINSFIEKYSRNGTSY